MKCYHCLFYFFFFNDTATTEIYTLSLHDALPIYQLDFREFPARHLEMHFIGLQIEKGRIHRSVSPWRDGARLIVPETEIDRKSTRLNSSHVRISYAVFCLKKKKSESDCSSMRDRS